MSTEKADAIVIRQADFSESSRVITLFSKEFGRISTLAKGAKRLKGPFDAALDLLSECRIVFLKKSSGALHLLTQAKLTTKFVPVSGSLNSLYGGYYLADLVCCLTEEEDPDSHLYDLLVNTLTALSDPEHDSPSVIIQFEIQLLRLVGLFPNLTECTICGETIQHIGRYAHWVTQGGLLCEGCRKQEYTGKSVSAGSIAVLRRLMDDTTLSRRIKISKEQSIECHNLAVSAITNVLGRRPNTLRYLKFS